MTGGVSITSNTKVLGNQLGGTPFFIKIHNRLSTFMYIAGIGSIEPKMGGCPVGGVGAVRIF